MELVRVCYDGGLSSTSLISDIDTFYTLTKFFRADKR